MRRLDLTADCLRCAALCCVALPFDASDDFAVDKPAGVACRYLRPDCRCGIHPELRTRGFPGCAQFDCYGAGPRVTREFEGAPLNDPERDEAFRILRGVYELLWLLTEAVKLCAGTHEELAARLAAEISALEAIPVRPIRVLSELDLSTLTRAAHRLLRQVGSALGDRQATAQRLSVLRIIERPG